MINVRNVTIGDGIPKIIVPLVGNSKHNLMEEVKSVIELKPDIVEWRVDAFEKVENVEEVREILIFLRKSLIDIPLLFTFRSKNEGGKRDAPVEFYLELTRYAIRSKLIDLVDIELFLGDSDVKELVSLAKENGVFVVMSNHDFLKTPEKEEILSRLQKMLELGADIPKIAVMPNSPQDVITLLDATNSMKIMFPDTPIITVSMGGKGLISRLTGELFGSAATFASGKEKSAPGQISLVELRGILEILHKNFEV